MKHIRRISSKGQVTVPRKIRTRLGVAAGDQIEFVVEGKRIVIRPASSSGSSFAKYKGALPAFPGIGKINEWIHEMRDEDNAPAKKHDRR